MSALVRDSSNRRHSTSVDFGPFFVLKSAPANVVPHIDSLNPTSGTAGSSLTIAGSGFDATAANNYVLIGGVQAVITAANAGGTSLTVKVPAGLAGSVSVMVVTAAGTSNSVNSITH